MFYVSLGWVDYNRRLFGLFKACLGTHTSSFSSLGDLQSSLTDYRYSVFSYLTLILIYKPTGFFQALLTVRYFHTFWLPSCAERSVSEACEITNAMLNIFPVLHSFMSCSNIYNVTGLYLREKSAVRMWRLNTTNNTRAELLLFLAAGLSCPSLRSNSWTTPKLHHICVMPEVCCIPVEEHLFLLLHNTLQGWILITIMGETHKHCQKAQNTSVPQQESN